MNTEIAVSVHGLEKKFGRFTAVNRISFEVRRGEIFGFLGPNGAGKSTTIRMLCGILYPSGGGGRVAGYDLIREPDRIKQHIGYMSQRFSLYEDLTVGENIDFYSGIYGVPRDKRRQRREWAVRMAGLEGLQGAITRNLSGGWKQRLALGCAVIHEPRIVFLDEPTSGVDPISRRNFWSLIRDLAEKGVTVFVTTHYMDEAENCGRLALIYRGAIIAMGTPRELKTSFMTGAVLQVSLPDPEGWIERLTALPGVRETALFGTVLHVAVADATASLPAIVQLLRENRVVDYRIGRITPSLEDVFVSLIEDYDKKMGAAN